jgi:4-hydroxybenzoate polyprenyltransferase/phosphoserine phosphatase
MQSVALKPESQVLFVVDLDDSLIKTDLILEKLISLALHSPASLCLAPLMMLKGRLAFKKWLASKTQIDFSSLPYRTDILDKVREARKRQETVILLSASLQEDVDRVVQHLKIFDAGVGSHSENLIGSAKLKFLKDNYPGSRVTYVGDSLVDLKIWKECDKIIAVNPSAGLVKKLQSINKPTELVIDRKNQIKLVIRELRVYQWVKNILVFLPVFAAHRFFEPLIWIHSARAFVAFSFLASAVYVFNDICDLSHDRKQPSKQNRPLASGALALKTALVLIPSCLVVSLFAAWGLPKELPLILGIYFLMNFIYSFWVKELLAIDVIFLAGFYTLRIFAGGAATSIPVSEWLLSFSVFFFFGMAMVKRFSELRTQPSNFSGSKLGRRAYEYQDATAVLVTGASTSILSILILALYLSTGEVKRLYQHPNHLWFVTPCLLFWLNRLWILGSRGQVTEDPLVFALKDKVTWWVAIGIVLVVLSAI